MHVLHLTFRSLSYTFNTTETRSLHCLRHTRLGLYELPKTRTARYAKLFYRIVCRPTVLLRFNCMYVILTLSLHFVILLLLNVIHNKYVSFIRTGTPQLTRGPHRPENVGQQRYIFWPVRAFCGVLRHLKVHLVQHNILWPIEGFRIQKAVSQIRYCVQL